MGTSGSYGKICGVVVADDRTSKTRRCYALGMPRYGGRCREHERLGEEVAKSRQAPRCGHVQRTVNGWPCSSPVYKLGDRCAKHDVNGLATRKRVRREQLEERVEHFTRQHDRYVEKIAALRAEIASLDDDEDEPMAAQ